MHNIVIAGGGKIGTTIAHLLARSKQYHVTLVDCQLDYIRSHFDEHEPEHLEIIELNIQDPNALTELIQTQNFEAIVSCLPYFCNKVIADLAKQFHLHYFDLTEDRETSNYIKSISHDAKIAFIPQCGLAPGFINIVANDLMQKFKELEDVKLRCGALPVNASNALQYALTWSADGVINEYGNPCEAVVNGQTAIVSPLENLETIQIEGAKYEAFNTSGGLGTLAETYQGKINNLNYKTIRYPGHCEKMRFLMNGLKLNNDRGTLKKILLNALPYTTDDVVIIYVSVNGRNKSELIQKNYVNKFYPKNLDNIHYGAIQLTTASSACCVINTVLNHPNQFHGFIKQEDFKLTDITDNEFGDYYKKS